MSKRTAAHTLRAALLATVLVIAGCAGGDGGSTSDGDGGSGGELLEIGITQIVAHPSLDATREGFKQAFADAGYVEGETVEFDEQDAQGDQATATTIAGTFASQGKDLILAIATPTAQAAAQATQDIPVLFAAVTEPQEAGLVADWEEPGGNVTGTSDLNPVDRQLGLIREIKPEATTVGIVYSSGEVNSQVQVDLAAEAADSLGLELKTATVTNSGEVQQAAQSLDVDAFYVPTDNTVVTALESLIQVAETKGAPIISADGESVERGCVATYGIDYFALGYQTGQMALRILEGGEDPATMPVETLDELSLVVNPGAAERMGAAIPQALLDQADRVVE